MKQVYDWLSELFPEQRHARTLLLVVVACAFYPFYLLTWYMADKGFYAYEAFCSVFGLVIPFLLMAFIFGIVLLLFAAMFWGGPLAALSIVLRDAGAQAGAADVSAARPEERAGRAALSAEGRKSLKGAAGIAAFNLLMLGLFGYAMYDADFEGARRFFWTLAIGSVALGLVLVVIQATQPAARFVLYALLFATGLFVPIFAREHVTSAVETTLTQFRLGGVVVTVAPNVAGPPGSGAPEGLRAKLVLLSSSNLYLEAGCPRRFLIVPRQPSMRLEFAALRT